MSHQPRPFSAMTIPLVNGFWRRSRPQMAVHVRQNPGFGRLTGLSCDAFHKTYGIILAIELGFMPFMLAGPYFGSRHDNVHDYPIIWLFHALKNYIYMIHLIYPCEISKFRAWARRCGWDVLVLSPFRPSFACFQTLGLATTFLAARDAPKPAICGPFSVLQQKPEKLRPGMALGLAAANTRWRPRHCQTHDYSAHTLPQECAWWPFLSCHTQDTSWIWHIISKISIICHKMWHLNSELESSTCGMTWPMGLW